jgi:hypothetical protein
MKDMIAKDSDNLLVLDHTVNRRGLFSYVLPRVLCYVFLLGLTAYGFCATVLPEIIDLWK